MMRGCIVGFISETYDTRVFKNDSVDWSGTWTASPCKANSEYACYCTSKARQWRASNVPRTLHRIGILMEHTQYVDSSLYHEEAFATRFKS
jgi:hypothetical protein